MIQMYGLSMRVLDSLRGQECEEANRQSEE